MLNEESFALNSPPRAISFERSDFVQHFDTVIHALPEQIALVDEKWVILAVNPAWTRTASLYGYEALRPGTNYAAFCRERAGEGHNAARPAVAGIDEIDAGRRSSFDYLYDGNDRWEGHTFRLAIHRFSIDGHTLATITRHDVSELIRLRREREMVSHTLLQTQSEERRRVAREIHDSTQQLLVSVELGLGQLRRCATVGEVRDRVEDLEKLTAELHREIRAISYLAHPPSLERLGLARALEELVAGFARRTGLAVPFRCEGDDTLGWPAAEAAIYRVAQEALSNVHRHAHATRADVLLSGRKSMVHLVTRDDGTGISAAFAAGVGLPAMKARISELGGRLFVRTSKTGTTLIASVPRKPRLRRSGDLAA